MSSAQVSQPPTPQQQQTPQQPQQQPTSPHLSQLLISHIAAAQRGTATTPPAAAAAAASADYDQSSNTSTLSPSPRSSGSHSPSAAAAAGAASPAHSSATTSSPHSAYAPTHSPTAEAQTQSQSQLAASAPVMPLLVAPIPMGCQPGVPPPTHHPHAHAPHPRLYVEGGFPPQHVPHPGLVNGTYPLQRLPLTTVMLPANAQAALPLPPPPAMPVSIPVSSCSPPATTTALQQPKKSFCIDALLAKNQHQTSERQLPPTAGDMIVDDHRLAALHYARDQAELNHAFVAASNAAAAAAAVGISDHEALQRIRESRDYDSPSPDGMSRYVFQKQYNFNAMIQGAQGVTAALCWPMLIE